MPDDITERYPQLADLDGKDDDQRIAVSSATCSANCSASSTRTTERQDRWQGNHRM